LLEKRGDADALRRSLAVCALYPHLERDAIVGFDVRDAASRDEMLAFQIQAAIARAQSIQDAASEPALHGLAQ